MIILEIQTPKGRKLVEVKVVADDNQVLLDKLLDKVHIQALPVQMHFDINTNNQKTIEAWALRIPTLKSSSDMLNSKNK